MSKVSTITIFTAVISLNWDRSTSAATGGDYFKLFS
jgi:hypothetical protein